MGDLPYFVLALMWFNVNVVQHAQPYCMAFFLLLAVWSALKAIRVACGDLGYVDFCRKICRCGMRNTTLETKFQPTCPPAPDQLSDLAVK